MSLSVINSVVQALTLLAIATGAWQLLAHSRQMHRDFESMYVQRYWTSMDRRSSSWILSGRFGKDDLLVDGAQRTSPELLSEFPQVAG